VEALHPDWPGVAKPPALPNDEIAAGRDVASHQNRTVLCDSTSDAQNGSFF
jgi:hypothetical protein